MTFGCGGSNQVLLLTAEHKSGRWTTSYELLKDQSSVFTNNAWALTYTAELVEDIAFLTLPYLTLLNAFCTGRIIRGAIQESRMRELHPK